MKSKRKQRRAAHSPSKGLGDTIAKLTKATYLDALVGVYTDFTGKPCNCEERREKLNRLVPYSRKKAAKH